MQLHLIFVDHPQPEELLWEALPEDVRQRTREQLVQAIVKTMEREIPLPEDANHD